MQTMVQTGMTPDMAALGRVVECAPRACRGVSAYRKDMTLMALIASAMGDVALAQADQKTR